MLYQLSYAPAPRGASRGGTTFGEPAAAPFPSLTLASKRNDLVPDRLTR
jgi:hypothetical protein